MSVALHQIYFKSWQRKYLDRNLLAYDNTANLQPAFAEYHIFKTEFENGGALRADLTGYVSWKFKRKTKISGRRFKSFIEQNPGYDVYFINPFPDLVARWKGPWEQGERNHPGLASYADGLFKKIYPEIDLSNMIGTHENVCYCNYWVGNEKFWRGYMDFTAPIYDHILNGASEEERAFLFSSADQKGRATYVPYLMERLFTTYLVSHDDIRALSYRYSPTELKRRYGTAAAAVDKACGLKSLLVERGVPYDDMVQSFVSGMVREELARYRQSFAQTTVRRVKLIFLPHLF